MKQNNILTTHKYGTLWHRLSKAKTADEFVAVLFTYMQTNDDGKMAIGDFYDFFNLLEPELEETRIDEHIMSLIRYLDLICLIDKTESDEIKLTDKCLTFLSYRNDKAYQSELFKKYCDI